MKRLGLFLPSLEGGGAERVMVTLANEFTARGYQVDLVLKRATGPLLSDVSEDVRVVDLATERLTASLPGLVSYLRRERPRAILTALNNPMVLSAIAVALARSGTRVVVSIHNNVGKERANSSRRDLFSFLFAPCLKRCHKIVAVSEGVKDNLATLTRIPRKRITTIYNPIVTSQLLLLKDEAPTHPWLRDHSVPVILTAGRLTAQKDFATLIEAFALVRRSQNVRLVILGEGEQRRELEARIAHLGLVDEILLTGYVRNPYVWMKNSSLFVLSSRWEGFGNVLVEAMACGTPVVATDCASGPAEILENGKWGRLVPVGNAQALSMAIAKTLADRFGEHATERAMHFTAAKATTAYLQLLTGEPN